MVKENPKRRFLTTTGGRVQKEALPSLAGIDALWSKNAVGKRGAGAVSHCGGRGNKKLENLGFARWGGARLVGKNRSQELGDRSQERGDRSGGDWKLAIVNCILGRSGIVARSGDFWGGLRRGKVK